MKKFLAILLALAMILALSTTAFADEEETIAMTITGIKNHTYRVYQIYTGDVSDEDGILVMSNIKYGQNHYPAADTGLTIGDLVSEADLSDFLNSSNPSNYFLTQIKGDPIAVINPDGTETSAAIDVVAGYYLIVDVTADLPDGETKSPIILKVAEEITITSKHATITSTKKVDDKNDSTTDEDAVNWKDSADYDIGDKVPFQLTVTLPTTLSAYNTYELTFHDDQAEGLDAPEEFDVSIVDKDGNTKVVISPADADGNGYTVTDCTSANCEYGGCSFTVKVGDIKALYGTKEYADGDMIVVTYKSELNEKAVAGSAGNPNSMYVCHPDGHTTQDIVTVLTYALRVTKIDGAFTDRTELEGAGFTLQKWINEEGIWKDVGDEITGVTTFEWSGIDGGKYKLKETTTPAGYNTIADIEFVINANHTEDDWYGANLALNNLLATKPDGTGVVFADNVNGVEDGILEGDVVNYKGTVLPETGAQGTFLLITCSALLAVAASVFMVTRKKMSIYED